jgi:glutamine cyclotransferase
LAYDGEDLILSDGTATLQFMDAETFALKRKVAVTLNGNPINYLNELEYINGEVWANVWQTDFIVRIDPATGVVNSFIDLAGLSEKTSLGGDAKRHSVGCLWTKTFCHRKELVKFIRDPFGKTIAHVVTAADNVNGKIPRSLFD